MASTVLGFVAGACAVFAILAAAGAVLGLVASADPAVRRPVGPAIGCAASGLVWALAAIMFGWMSSAFAGR